LQKRKQALDNKVEGPLTDRLIKKAMHGWKGPKDVLIKDSSNLFLRIVSNEAAAWVYRYKWRGSEKRMGFGSYPMTTIALARMKRDAAGLQRAQGVDPSIEKKQAARRGMTFEVAAREYWENHCQGFAKPSNWIAAMENHVFPKIGKKEVAGLTVDDLVPVMQPIWDTHNGKKIRGWINKVIGNVGSEDDRVDLDLMLKVRHRIGKQSIPENNLAAMPYRDVPKLWLTIPSDTPAALSMQLVILSGVREDAAIRADWSEVDLKRRVWSIPKERCKGWDTGFEVPITDDIKTVFEAAGRLFGREGVVFPSETKSGFVSGNTHRKWLQDRGWKDDHGKLVTAHGLRTSIRTWGQEVLRGDASVYEHILMHVTAKGSEVTRAYARSGRFDERKEVMETWAKFVKAEAREKIAKAKEDQRFERDLSRVIAQAEGRGMTQEEAMKWVLLDELVGDEEDTGAMTQVESDNE
jgi:integrase